MSKVRGTAELRKKRKTCFDEQIDEKEFTVFLRVHATALLDFFSPF